MNAKTVCRARQGAAPKVNLGLKTVKVALHEPAVRGLDAALVLTPRGERLLRDVPASIFSADGQGGATAIFELPQGSLVRLARFRALSEEWYVVDRSARVGRIGLDGGGWIGGPLRTLGSLDFDRLNMPVDLLALQAEELKDPTCAQLTLVLRASAKSGRMETNNGFAVVGA